MSWVNVSNAAKFISALQCAARPRCQANDIVAAPNAGPHRTQKRNDYGSIALTQNKQDCIMTKTATPRQRKTTGRVMHEFKRGELKSGRGGKGGKVKSRRQAIAIALKEAGASKYESGKRNKRNLTKSGKAAPRWAARMRPGRLPAVERPCRPGLDAAAAHARLEAQTALVPPAGPRCLPWERTSSFGK
jgi:hypothetical protein